MPDLAIKDALKLIPYGFYALTTRDGDDINAMVFNWFSQVSFDPRLVAVGLQKAPKTGAPVLDGAAAYIEFEVHDIIDIGGDHDIVVGRPVGAGMMKEISQEEVLDLAHLGWSYAG